MSVIPQGKSIQALYNDYRAGKLIVNRKYQRKLVWSIQEKQKLIDSILNGYPIPLILLAAAPTDRSNDKYEIVDGIQRLNAIFSFIENNFDINGNFFDIKEFTRARQIAKEGIFKPKEDGPFLEPKACADVLDYQLAITIYPIQDEQKITDVFGRINSNGRILSYQEQRQAGITTQFCSFIRMLSSEIRGDVSKDLLLLSEMPEISIERGNENYGYGIQADNTIWCKQGILSVPQLKSSEDEQFITDFVVSILLNTPIPASKEYFDKLFNIESSEGKEIEKLLISYQPDKLSREIKSTFSIINEVIESQSSEQNALRNLVRKTKTANPIRAPFYAIFMAFFDLIVKEQKTPDKYNEIWKALGHLDKKLAKETHYQTTASRIKNINLTKGLIQDYFIKREPSILGHGPSLIIDFENSLRRSRIETSRFELKQGILPLDSTRKLDKNFLDKLIKTICAISNLGKNSEGVIYLGVADNDEDAKKIEKLDKVTPLPIANRFVVGINREAAVLNKNIEGYNRIIVSAVQNSNLSEPLKSQILTNFDIIDFRGLSVIRIFIPSQKQVSFINEKAFYREGSNTKEALGPKLLAINNLF